MLHHRQREREGGREGWRNERGGGGGGGGIGKEGGRDETIVERQ